MQLADLIGLWQPPLGTEMVGRQGPAGNRSSASIQCCYYIFEHPYRDSAIYLAHKPIILQNTHLTNEYGRMYTIEFIYTTHSNIASHS